MLWPLVNHVLAHMSYILGLGNMDMYDSTNGEKIENEIGLKKKKKGEDWVKGSRSQSDGAFEHSFSLSHD